MGERSGSPLNSGKTWIWRAPNAVSWGDGGGNDSEDDTAVSIGAERDSDIPALPVGSESVDAEAAATWRGPIGEG